MTCPRGRGQSSIHKCSPHQQSQWSWGIMGVGGWAAQKLFFFNCGKTYIKFTIKTISKCTVLQYQNICIVVQPSPPALELSISPNWSSVTTKHPLPSPAWVPHPVSTDLRGTSPPGRGTAQRLSSDSLVSLSTMTSRSIHAATGPEFPSFLRLRDTWTDTLCFLSICG